MARPVHHRSPTVVQPGPLVRDYSGGRGAEVEVVFDARTPYDFVFSLSPDAGSTDDLPGPDRRWLATAREEMSKLFGESLSIYGSQMCILLAGLVVDRPEVQDAAAFVDLVSDLGDETIVRTIVGDLLRDETGAELVDRAIDGDADAIQAVIDREKAHDPEEDVARFAALFRRPESVLGPARGILSAWLERFAPLEERVRLMLERDVELRADDRALAPAALIERTTGGVRFTSTPGVRRVVLAPSYFSRPYNYLLAGVDWRLFGYPISDAALGASDPLAPPQAVVRFHRALGDDTRLRILRLLRERDLYLTEIAQLLELSKPTIKHHLAQLRVAGVVTVTEEAGLTWYSLRRERLETAATELRRYLLD
jgi:DNA-binding transcriptional ArsR family regulator